ncbi:uncharacterized protein LOC126908009 isoform X3 [Daktulosphaira vitifoliae]|uniref:uncharacterized protein LOC126908009 isoform X3 n=1 Tax=Daktulosphaira vitifoliae TaxID=58002 RepID=UPI0021AA8A8F|nr:uncharacterized protein LOC126908009 isoform X3 [Daktulosphaira vitifoliae]
MFNLGGALKNITDKAEGLLEEKKTAATALLEKQVKETGEFLAHTVSDVEGKAEEAKKDAIEGFDHEIEKIADGALQEEPTPTILPASDPATITAPSSIQKSAVDQVATEAKTFVDKTAADLKPVLGQVVQDKINPLAQEIGKKLQPVAGDVSSHINTALADGVKQLNPVVDDVSIKAKSLVDDTAKQVSGVVDEKLKEVDHLMTEKRDALGQPAISMFSKAKGLFGCKLGCCCIM